LDPLWKLHKAGPFVFAFDLGVSALIGWATHSPAWGVVVLLAGLFGLGVWDVMSRQREAVRRLTAEQVLVGDLLGRGDDILRTMRMVVTFRRVERTVEDAERTARVARTAADMAHTWMRNAEDRIRTEISDQAAALFRAHSLISVVPITDPDAEQYWGQTWRDMATRLQWLAHRLADLEQGTK